VTERTLGIEPTVTFDQSANKGHGAWLAHWEERPCVIRNAHRPTEEEAWALIRGEESEQISGTEAVNRIERLAAQMARAAREEVGA